MKMIRRASRSTVKTKSVGRRINAISNNEISELKTSNIACGKVKKPKINTSIRTTHI